MKRVREGKGSEGEGKEKENGGKGGREGKGNGISARGEFASLALEEIDDPD